jgi:hypothetical protein
VPSLARQCWQLDDQALAQHLFGVALGGAADGPRRLPLALAGLEFLGRTRG